MISVPARTFEVRDLIERADYWRRSPASVGGPAGHKEWSYFCVLGDQVQLVCAFSIMDQPPLRRGTPASVEEARVTLLVRTPDGRWCGDVELCDRARVRIEAGCVDASFHDSEIAFADGAYQLRVHVGDPPIRVELALRPTARPAMTRSVPLGDVEPMQWFVVPRLAASGSVVIHGCVHVVRESPAYHDHNWGRFNWGGDFAWEWGIALGSAAVPWSLTYYRISDRGRHTVVSQGLLLWSGDRHERTFRDGELTVRSTGTLRTANAFRVPRIMRLAAPGAAGDLPTQVEVRATNGEDDIEVRFELDDCAQICIPHDTDDGVTMISECLGRAVATGRMNGRAIQFFSSAVVEFNRAAA